MKPLRISDSISVLLCLTPGPFCDAGESVDDVVVEVSPRPNRPNSRQQVDYQGLLSKAVDHPCLNEEGESHTIPRNAVTVARSGHMDTM